MEGWGYGDALSEEGIFAVMGVLALKRGTLTEEGGFAVMRVVSHTEEEDFAVRIFSPCPYIVTLGLNVIISY